MTRIKRGVAARKHKKNILKKTKGYYLGRKTRIKIAKQAVIKAGQNAYYDRKRKKADFRAVWNIRLNGALRTHGVSYSKFIGMLKKQKIELNRKVLSELAATDPTTFGALVKQVTEASK